MIREGLIALVDEAWEAFESAPTSRRLVPAMPILFFGDLDGYFSSRLRVLTVGLNPSWHEFPKSSPFQRFPECAGIAPTDGAQYLEGLSAYFRRDPYKEWFRAYEAALGGADASYWGGRASTALHTDIASPVATDPAWGKLDEVERVALRRKGGRLWHRLVAELKPHLVLASLAREHLLRVEFAPLTDWKRIHEFEFKVDGCRRDPPYPVLARWFAIADTPALFVSGKQRNVPFGEIGNEQKREVGARSRRAYGKGPEGLA